MKRFWYKFLVCVLSLGMLYPTWIATGTQKASASIDEIPPYLTSVSFVSRFNADPVTTTLPGNPSTGFYLKNSGMSSDNHYLQFSSTSGVSEPLFADYNGLYLNVASLSVPVSVLEQYYNDREMPANYRDYLISALDGVTKPFAYIKTDGTINYSLVDAAKKDINNIDDDMTIPGDYPEGSYTVSGKIKDLAENESLVSFTIIIDRTGPSIVINHVANSAVHSEMQLSFDSNEKNSPKCSIDNVSFVSCVSGVTKFGDLFGFNDLGAENFTLYVQDTDLAGNFGSTQVQLVKQTVLPAPALLIAISGNGEVSLSWEPVIGAVSYNIYYKKSSDLSWVGPVNVISNSTKVTGLENGVKYDFSIRAVGDNGLVGVESIASSTPSAPSVVLASAPTVQDAVVAQPETPVATPEVTKEVEENESEVGQIKGEETVATEEEINWTPWIILFVLIVLAGAATGGYFYWFGSEEEEIVSEKVIEKSRKTDNKKISSKKQVSKKNKRW